MRGGRSLVVSTALCMALVAIAGCSPDAGSPSSSGKGVEISVTHPDDLYGVPWLVGRDRGFFESAGVKIDRIVPAEGGGATLQNVVAGKLPFGEVATGAVVKGALEGAPIEVIGGGVQSVADVLWLAPTGSGLEGDPLAVANKKWGFTNPGSVTEAMSYLVPEAAGIEGVERVSTGGTGAGIALLEAGDVDLAYAPPRVAAEQDDAFEVILNSADFVPVYQQTVIITSRDYAAQNPEQAKGLLQGYAEAVEWISANPDDAATLWSENVDIAPDVAKKLVTDAVAAEHWGAAFNKEALQAAANGLKVTDDIQEVNWGDIAVDTYLPENARGELP